MGLYSNCVHRCTRWSLAQSKYLYTVVFVKDGSRIYIATSVEGTPGCICLLSFLSHNWKRLRLKHISFMVAHIPPPPLSQPAIVGLPHFCGFYKRKGYSIPGVILTTEQLPPPCYNVQYPVVKILPYVSMCILWSDLLNQVQAPFHVLWILRVCIMYVIHKYMEIQICYFKFNACTAWQFTSN